jgi:uncharacterized repeat protein (TIGR03803 family)
MTKLDGWKAGWAVIVVCVATVCGAHAQIFTTLASFGGGSSGSSPNGVVQGINGNYYGTTFFDGTYNGEGVAFEMTPTGALTTLHTFAGYPAEGGNPEELLLSTDGSFYGTTYAGGTYNNGFCYAGCGTVFKMTPGGVLTTLYNFCAQPGCPDGARIGGMTQGTDGNFYGSTSVGGANDGGTIFRITRQGQLATLYSFCAQPGCPDGSDPGGLIQGTDGNFYGATFQGGISNLVCFYTCGTVFKITPAGKLTTLHRFCADRNCTDGANPGGLIQAKDGNFYGTALYGGSSPNCGISGCGTLFKITREGKFMTLHNFAGCPTEGSSPTKLLQATDENLYGITLYDGIGCEGYGLGTVFEMTSAGQLTILYSFCSQNGCTDGSVPDGLLQATDGKFYGAASQGGIFNTSCQYGCGTIFSLDVGLGPFIAFMQPFGRVGQTGGILGEGLTGATSVVLNGIPASFTLVSDTFIKATVPQGATTGYVTVTTPSGTLTSNVPFHVIK